MNVPTDPRIEQFLQHYGVTADPESVRASGCGITFRFRDPHQAPGILGNRNVFAKGRLGVLHGKEVGGLICDYRSFTNGHGCSLHVVLGKSGTAFADIDRFNPYQGPLQMLLHGVFELAPHLMRRVKARVVSMTTGRTHEKPFGV